MKASQIDSILLTMLYCLSLTLGAFVSAMPAFAESSHVAAHTSSTTQARPDASDLNPWGADYFPNIVLTTHQGRQVKFFDDLVRDKVVAINFIYTHCPDVCPLETTRMKEVYQLLSERVGKDVFFYSITIDPERDTPQVLAEYVDKFQIPAGWLFLTGSASDIVLLRQKLGLYIEDLKQEGNNYDHNINLIIGNQASGRWMKRSPFENPYILAEQIGGELHNWQRPRTHERDYANAPELPGISPAEQLFRTRCSSCHSIGAAQLKGGSAVGESYGSTNLGIGPDLYNITRQRDRRWLLRWISQPDRMLAEGDPIALGLYEQYQRIAMPNLSLNTQEVESLLSFIDDESRRITQQRNRQQADSATTQTH